MTQEHTKAVTPQTKEWIEGITIQFDSAQTVDELLDLGMDYLRLPYVPDVVKPCFAHFRKCLSKLETRPPEERGTVVAVDFPAVFHAAHATNESMPDVLTSVAKRLAAIHTGTGCEESDVFLLAIDSETSWRKKVFADYKGERPEKPEGFREAMQEALRVCRAAGRTVVEIDGHESDDILASVSYRAKLRQQSAILVTEDKDIWQCLGMGTVMYLPSGKYFTEEQLLATQRINPRQVVDWLAMTGKNDVPDCHGIGKKIASDLLEAYGSFWNIYDAREKLTEKKREAIEAFAKDGYWLARDLHTLRKGLRVKW